MKIATKILLVVVGLLLVVDIFYRIRANNKATHFRAFGQEFKIETIRTNDVAGIGLFEVKEKPLWVEFGLNSESVIESCYFQGKDVFDIVSRTNHPPAYSVYFHGKGKSETWWLDREGVGAFNERIFYDTNGDFSKHEIWYQDTWQTVDRRNEKNGIIINGQWHQLAFDTNHNWTIETTTNR